MRISREQQWWATAGGEESSSKGATARPRLFSIQWRRSSASVDGKGGSSTLATPHSWLGSESAVDQDEKKKWCAPLQCSATGSSC